MSRDHNDDEITALRAQVQALELKVKMQEQMLAGCKAIVRQLADAFDLGKPPEGYALYKVNTEKRVSGSVTESMMLEMKEQYLNGVSFDRIAVDMGLHETTVRKKLIEMGVHVDSQRLTKKIVDEMVVLFQQGKPLTMIAKQFHISPATVAHHLEIKGLRQRKKYVGPSDAHRRRQSALMQNGRIRRS